MGTARYCQAKVPGRLHFLRRLAAACLVVLLFAVAGGAEEFRANLPQITRPPSAIDKLIGEHLSYDISFLWFDRLARGTLSFSRLEDPRTYQAVLEARTLGVAAWLTRDRVQRYVSVMEIGPDGRFRSLSHESHVRKGKGDSVKDRTSLYLFDHGKREIRYLRARDGRYYKDERLPMEEGESPNDILTAFYNFRAGFFGSLREGDRYTVPTFDHEGTEEIVVEILSPGERPRDDFFPSGGLLGRVTLPAEVFDTGGGNVYVWFDESRRPTRGLVENVIGLGHVRGKLR